MKNLIMCLIFILMTSVFANAAGDINSRKDTLIINVISSNYSFDCAATKPGPPLAINTTIKSDVEFSVYPNPATNNLTIKSQVVLTKKFEAVYLYVFDMKGRVVMEQKDICNTGSIYQKELNVRVLPQGDYIIKLIIGKYSCIRKFEVYY